MPVKRENGVERIEYKEIVGATLPPVSRFKKPTPVSPCLQSQSLPLSSLLSPPFLRCSLVLLIVSRLSLLFLLTSAPHSGTSICALDINIASMLRPSLERAPLTLISKSFMAACAHLQLSLLLLSMNLNGPCSF